MATMSLRERMSSSTIGNRQLRVSVIGASTVNTETRKPYTVYRTLVRFQGECYERQLRYSAFRSFHNQLKLKDSKESIQAPFPPRVWLYRSSMSERVVESRKVLLDEYMRQVCRKELADESEEILWRLLRVGPFEDPHGRLSTALPRRRSIGNKDPSKVEVIHEHTEEESIETQSDRDRKPLEVGTASIVYNSCVYPSQHSNAETVLTEDERSSSEVHSNDVTLMGQDGVDLPGSRDPIDSAPSEPHLPSTPPSTPIGGEEGTTDTDPFTMGQPEREKGGDGSPLSNSDQLNQQMNKIQKLIAETKQEEEEEQGREDVDGLVPKSTSSSYADQVGEQLNKIQHLLVESKQAEEQVSRQLQPSTALTA